MVIPLINMYLIKDKRNLKKKKEKSGIIYRNLPVEVQKFVYSQNTK